MWDCPLKFVYLETMGAVEGGQGEVGRGIRSSIYVKSEGSVDGGEGVMDQEGKLEAVD